MVKGVTVIEAGIDEGSGSCGSGGGMESRVCGMRRRSQIW